MAGGFGCRPSGFASLQVLADHGSNSDSTGFAQRSSQELTTDALKLIVAGVSVVRWIASGHRAERLFCFLEPLAQQDAFKVSGRLVDLSSIGVLRLPLEHAKRLRTPGLIQVLVRDRGRAQGKL